jgi:hypothetical protein
MQLQRPCFGDIRKFIIFAMGFQAGPPQGILLLSNNITGFERRGFLHIISIAN